MMSKSIIASISSLILLFQLSVITTLRAENQTAIHSTSAGDVQVKRMAGPFSHPWALAFLPDANILITERGGSLWLVHANGNRTRVKGVPEVHSQQQGGLLDVVAARDFSSSREIFLSYSEPVEGNKSRTAIAVARLNQQGDRLENLRVIFRQSPAESTSHHYGSRIVEAPDGNLWVTLGDRGNANKVQNINNHIGKVIRIARDGTIPDGNPWATQPGAAENWSYGHRNPQGAALDPQTGALWTVEHGAKGGDEINRPGAGLNYGWPIIAYGTHYTGLKIGEGTHKQGMQQPVHYWDPSIAPSGMMIYSGKLWPEWEGNIFVGALKYQLISRLHRDGDSITGEERILKGVYGRIRDVREGPAGAIWFLTDENDGALYRVMPE
jgi:glucose/arabinose dehydrogenase